VDKDIDIWKQRNEILHKKVNRQMDEIKDLHKKSETIFDLARRFPNKTYRELEKYRDADRQEEAQQIPLSESQKKQEELEPIEGEEQDNPELFDWKEQYNKERKLRQEAEGELTIVKGISVHMSPEMRQTEKKIKELETRLAELLSLEDKHQELNGKLQMRMTELEQDNLELHADNKKLAKQVEDSVDKLRKQGII